MVDTRRKLSQSQWIESLGIDPFWIVQDDPQSMESAAENSLSSLHTISKLNWNELVDAVEVCNSCGLSEKRKFSVAGHGDGCASWLLIGDAPKDTGVINRKPFEGQSARLLDAMLASVELNQEQGAYLTTVIKCSTQVTQRQFDAGSVSSCKRYLYQQISLMKPNVILLLGNATAKLVLDKELPLDRLRGNVHELQLSDRVVPVVVTHDPSDILSNFQLKAEAWQDLLLAKSVETISQCVEQSSK